MNDQKEQQKLALGTSKILGSFASVGKLCRGKTGLSCSLLVLIVLAGLFVAVFSRQGTDTRFDLPEELSAFFDKAIEICSDDDPWKAGCVGAVWTVCEESRSFRLNYASGKQDYNSIDDVREIPEELICRAAHLAELGRLASVLAGRYGDEFYVEEVKTDWSVKFGDFWRFRRYITYTPWAPVEIYGGALSDVMIPGEPRPDIVGPRLYDGIGTAFTVGRWLEKIQDWGFDVPSKFDMLSDKSVNTINSLLGKIVDLTKPYDSWPIEATSDPRTGRVTRQAIQGPIWDYYLLNLPDYLYPSGASEAARGVYEICLAAITEAKIGASGWEDEIDDCRKASTPCAQSSDDTDALCSIMPILAEKEQSWQQLPSVCEETSELGNSRSDKCLNAINRICNSRSHSLRMGEINFKRNLSIHRTACLIMNR